MKEAYLYIWHDTKNKMYYVGVHLHKDGDDYAHSSTVMESFTYSTRPDYMKQKILKWGTWDEMYETECRLIREKCAKSDRYYNVNNIPNARKAGKIGGLKMKGYIKSKTHIENLRKAAIRAHANMDSSHKEETRKKISESQKGNKNFDINKGNTRKNHSEGMKRYWAKRKAKEKKLMGL
tara:strand:- start:205 stop:741 length:537 start_codon:yes stop_codon:yes gene_type:complete